MGLLRGPQARTDRTQDARVAEPRPPVLRGRAVGGGTAPDTRRPSQKWRADPPGTAPHYPRGTQPPLGMQA